MSEEIGRRPIPPPGPLDDHEASLDANIRQKLDRGEPLTEEEAHFLANLPATREVPPGAFRATAAQAGSPDPIDAKTGQRHDARERR